MSHSIIINGYRVFPFHDDGDGLVATPEGEKAVIEFGDITYRPKHGETNAGQAAQVVKILKALGKLGEHAE
jgi:hypothetical protein